jgi:hypothetical protein
MRICKECGIEKNESEFFKHRNSFQGKCKLCRREQIKKLEKNNPEKYKKKERERNLIRNATNERKLWREKNREKNEKNIALQCRKYRTENKENLYEKAKLWREKNKEKYCQSIKRHHEQNPHKRRARQRLFYHIKKGNMTRPNFCSKCNKECIPEAHHEDYTKALDVKWLCRSCHGYEHRIIKE